MLDISPVTTAEEVEAVRTIFNECREFMTKKFDPITHEQQAAWWEELRARKHKAFIYRDNGEIVAYSLLQWRGGRVTPLFGIKQSAVGKNYARRIIMHYLKEAGEPLFGEELSSHKAMIKLNIEAGWQFLREENGVRYLYHPNKKTYPDYEGMADYWKSA